MYTIDNEVVVDRVYFYESLEDSLESIRLQLGIAEPLVLPSAKSEWRKDQRNYREILTNDEREKIADLFRDEIALFGFVF